MKGWFLEPQRHSLAAKGISTRARALVKPSGELSQNTIDKIYRVERTIKDLGDMLKRGYVGHDISRHGIYGGLTTTMDTESYIHIIGNIYVELDVEKILKKNDLIEVEYEPEFFLRNPDVAENVDFRISYPIKSMKLAEYLSTEYRDECELVSRKPILIDSDDIKSIEIHYGGKTKNIMTGEHPRRSMDEDESREVGKKAVAEIRKEIPSIYWDRIWLFDETTGGEYHLEDIQK